MKSILIASLPGIVAAIISSYVFWKTQKKRSFNDVVTQARKEHLQELRSLAAEFLYLADKKITEGASDDEKRKRLSYQIRLMLNPMCSESKPWDGRISELLKLDSLKKDELEELDARFVSLMQIEWRGICDEANNGNLTSIKKSRLRDKHNAKFKNYTEEQGYKF